MQVPFARDSYSSEVPINWYPAADTDRNVVMMGAPGLKAVFTLELTTEIRAMEVVGDFLYAVLQGMAG